jgi:hypothetical protein
LAHGVPDTMTPAAAAAGVTGDSNTVRTETAASTGIMAIRN